MDKFDRYLLEELAAIYARTNLTAEDLESLYIRMSNLDHLEEAHPYLYAMRYFGWGTQASPQEVLKELSQLREMIGDDARLNGLYEDLTILSGKDTPAGRTRLKEAAAGGYSGVYLKSKSVLNGGSAISGRTLADKQKSGSARRN